MVRPPKPTGNAVADLMAKLNLCFKIFFPDEPKELVTPKEEVKRRLKMVLVRAGPRVGRRRCCLPLPAAKPDQAALAGDATARRAGRMP